MPTETVGTRRFSSSSSCGRQRRAMGARRAGDWRRLRPRAHLCNQERNMEEVTSRKGRDPSPPAGGVMVRQARGARTTTVGVPRVKTEQRRKALRGYLGPSCPCSMFRRSSTGINLGRLANEKKCHPLGDHIHGVTGVADGAETVAEKIHKVHAVEGQIEREAAP